MKTGYATLDHFLRAYNLPTVVQLSRRTGIPAARLRDIYLHHNPSPLEIDGLLKVLMPVVAAFIAGQTGNFNQAGSQNTLNLTINVLVQQAPVPHEPEAIGIVLPHHGGSNFLPGSQVDSARFAA